MTPRRVALGCAGAFLVALIGTQAYAQQARSCFCFGWVHGADHGTTCRPTRAACTRASRETTREHTLCAARERSGECTDDAFIDGTHHTR